MIPKENENMTNAHNNGLKRKLKEAISDILEELGQGLSDPVPYDTAWAARVPQADNIECPAFPLSLQWLRDHQLENGSWGTIKPFSPHSSTLNTLAAIIALAQWNNPQDKIRIERGVKVLWDLVNYLPLEKHEGVGFELILPALQNEARKHGLAIPHQHYKNYQQKGTKKFQLIFSELKEHGYKKPATWWHSLEVLGDNWQTNINHNNIELGFSWSMLTKNGSVGLSPAATAYMLRSQRLRGIDVPEAEHYLNEMYLLNKGGIPNCFPIDILELAFSIDFFLKAGFHAKHSLLKSAISRLADCWNLEDGVGYSFNWKLFDADDTAVALHILHQAGYSVSTKPLLKFFNGTNISAYIKESTPSVSVNINALNTLRLFNGDKRVDEVVQKVLTWLDTSAFSKDQVFIDDKWNISPYYSASRAVSSLHGLRDDIVKRCIDFLIKSQNNDGGWGKDDFSTAEETAYVSLALSYGLRQGYHIPETVIETANRFLYSSECALDAPLWIDKVLYRPSLVSQSAIVAARYVLAKILELTKVKTMLNEIQPSYIIIDMKSIDSQQSYHASLLRLLPEFDVTKYSHQLNRVENYIVNRLIELKLLKAGEKLSKTYIVQGSAYILRNESSDEDRIMYITLCMAVFLYDDVLDKGWQHLKNNPDIVTRAFKTFLEILQGKYRNIDMVTSLDFPKFIPVCKLFFDVRCGLVKKQSNNDEFLLRIEKIFECFIREFNNRINDLSLSSKEYLEIGKMTIFIYAFTALCFILQDIDIYSFKDYKVFNEFENCALKAVRLITDILSFLRDLDKGWSDNYVLVKQTECNLSLEEAFNATIELYNKQIIKMFSLRNVMQSDLEYKDNQELFKAVVVVENCVQGSVDWSLRTRRYHSKTIVSVVRKQFKESDLPLVMKYFDNKVNEYTLENLELRDSVDATTSNITSD